MGVGGCCTLLSQRDSAVFSTSTTTRRSFKPVLPAGFHAIPAVWRVSQAASTQDMHSPLAILVRCRSEVQVSRVQGQSVPAFREKEVE